MGTAAGSEDEEELPLIEVEAVEDEVEIVALDDIEVLAQGLHDVATEQPLEVVPSGTFTIKRLAGFDPVDQNYLSDLLYGMLETDRLTLVLRRDRPLPYFGFLHPRPLACSFAGIVAFITRVLEVPPERAGWGGEGMLRTTVCEEEDVPVEILFGVEIGPRQAWVCISRGVEERVLRRRPGPTSF